MLWLEPNHLKPPKKTSVIHHPWLRVAAVGCWRSPCCGRSRPGWRRGAWLCDWVGSLHCGAPAPAPERRSLERPGEKCPLTSPKCWWNAGDLLGLYVGCWKLVKTYWSGWNMIQIEWWRETILFEEWFFKALGSRPAWCWGDGNTCDVFFLKPADFRKLRSCPSGSWGFFHWTITGGADLPVKLNSSMASFEHAFSRLGRRGWIWQACYLLRQRTSATAMLNFGADVEKGKMLFVFSRNRQRWIHLAGKGRDLI